MSLLSLDFLPANPLMQVLREMRDGVLVCDAELRTVLINPAFQAMLGAAELSPGHSLVQIVPNNELQDRLHGMLATGEAFDWEISLMCGSVERIFQIHAMPLTADTARSGCVLIFYDQTAIRKTEKMRRDFVANVSHELRTPLSAIRGYAETLLDGALTEDPAVAGDFVQVIYKHANRLTLLVEDLLDLSKLEATDFQAELEPIPLAPLVRHLQTLVESTVQAKELTLRLEIPDDLPLVLANPGNLAQVLTNLIDNAVKYTPTHGEVRLTAFESPHDARLIQVNIADTGMGIELKHIPRLFERFYRVDKARSREMGGTGLGLSIVKHIVQLHGGEIWVESQVGQGSIFSFTLQKA